ncbi:hypothetical protein [Viridibacillus arvi]|uniref:hypothetical protein n=1 Tax=Viridibacillus arvi TaxID=263475 RepID=UPI0034CFD3A7
MNKLNISLSTYCEIEKQLGIHTDDGLNTLLGRLLDIVDFRRNAGRSEYNELLNIIKLFRSLKIERDDSWGNTITIDDFDEINNLIFNNQNDRATIEKWFIRDMLTGLAEMIDEDYRYDLDIPNDTDLLRNLLFYLTIVRLNLK